MTLDPGAVVTKVCGFLEESPGVKSSTRLFAAILLALAAVVVALIVWYVMHTKVPDASVIGGLAGVLGALVVQGVVAIMRRNGDDK